MLSCSDCLLTTILMATNSLMQIATVMLLVAFRETYIVLQHN